MSDLAGIPRPCFVHGRKGDREQGTDRSADGCQAVNDLIGTPSPCHQRSADGKTLCCDTPQPVSCSCSTGFGPDTRRSGPQHGGAHRVVAVAATQAAARPA